MKAEYRIIIGGEQEKFFYEGGAFPAMTARKAKDQILKSLRKQYGSDAVSVELEGDSTIIKVA